MAGGGALSAAPASAAPHPERPRIALLGPAWPLRGGIAQYLALLYRALEARAEVAQFSLIRQYPSLLFPGKSQRDASAEPLRVPSEAVLDTVNPLQWPQAARRVTQFRPDAVVYKWWLPFFGPSYAAVLGAARRAGAVNVMIADNLVPHERRPLDGFFTRLVLARTDAFVVMSESVERDLHRLVPGARYRRIPHPVYAQYASAESRTEARRALGVDGDVLLFFGFIRRYKGLDLLLEALPRVRSRRPVTLLVAGEFYEPSAPYRERVAALGLGEQVHFFDRYLNDEEVRRLFAAADVCVLPYRSATQSGVVPVAYAAGCPVITTTVGGLPELVVEGRSGFTVAPEDPAALADAIVRFFERGGRTSMEDGVHAEAKKYTWDALAEGILDLIAEARGRLRAKAR